jgi:hypothetical protein
MANDKDTERKNDRPEERKESDNASREAQVALKDGKDPKQDVSMVAAQAKVSELFGDLTFGRTGVDADAASIHDTIAPNPWQAGGMMDQKTKDELALNGLKNHDADSLKQINESYKQQYGRDILDDMKTNMSPDAYRRAQEIMKGEKDPGYLSPTKADSDKALNSFTDANGRPLSDYTDSEQLAAIQRNEAVKRGLEDDLGIGKTDGPAQISKDTQAELLKKYPDQLKDVDVNSVDGSQMYVAAFNAREVDRFNSGWYEKEAQEHPEWNADKREKFVRIQQEWNAAVVNGDKDATRKILAERFNGGNPTQTAEVEAQRNQTPEGNRLRDASNTAGDVWTKIKSWVA